MKHLLGVQLWHLFKYAELTEVERQNVYLLMTNFIELINKVQICNIDDDVENLLKARFIHESDKNYPKDALHMYTENEPTMKRIEVPLNDLPHQLYTIKASDKIPDNCKYPLALIQAAQNQKQTTTGGLAKLLKLKIAAKVMLTVNIDIKDFLINGQTGIISHTEFATVSVCKVYVKFSDKQVCSKAMRSSNLGRKNLWALVEKCETTEISIKKGSASPFIKHTQFLLTIALTSAVHEVQGLSLEQGVIDFHLQKQKSFGLGQIYTAIVNVKTYDNLYCIGEFKKSTIKVNKDALLEYERLKKKKTYFPQ